MKESYKIKFGRERRVSAKHVKKQNKLLLILALNGALSKYDLSSFSDKKLRGIRNEEKFSWALVHKLINELKEEHKIRKYGELKGKKHVTTIYGLSFFGLLWYFAFLASSQDIERVIENCSKMHIIFGYWEEVKKSIGKRSSDLFDALLYASLGTLGLSPEALDMGFEKPSLGSDREALEEAFSMNFLRFLKFIETEYAVSITETSIPEVHAYLKRLFTERKKEFEYLEKLIQKYK